MIESARFTNVNGMYVDFNTDVIPFSSFTTEVDVRFTEKPKSQQHGIYAGNTFLGRRLFHCEGDIFASNSAEYIQRRMDMVAALIPRPQFGQQIVGVLEILFSGMNETLRVECTIDGYPEIPLDGASPARSRYQVNFKAYDPRLYGALQSMDIPFDPNWQNIGGRTYNKVYNKTYSLSSGTSGDTIIINSGNIETYPLVTIYGPATEPEALMIRSDGVVFRFRLTGLVLASVAESVFIDMRQHTVIRNDGTNAYQYAVGSDWWSLEPEFSNVVKFSASVLAQPAHMSIQWRNAYMF